MTPSCPLFEISGAPFERGRQYGEQAKAYIKKGIGHYSAQVSRLGLEAGGLHGIIRDYTPIIESFDANYVEEMRGIARGAEVSFDEIVLLNARTEVLKLAARPDLRRQLTGSIEPDGCTAVVVQPKASRDGALIHAHNWDWKYESAETSVVLRIRSEDGPDILTFTEAGALGRFGFNSVGIGITANYLESDRDYRQAGVPLALIRRKVLEQQHLAVAISAVYVTAKSGSNNIVVSHASGLVINFECAPDETFLIDPRDGLLVHANHWLSPIALTKFKDVGVASFPCSLYRDRRAREILEPKIGALTVDDVKGALFDDFGAPWSICRPARPSAINNLSATVAMIVMAPASGEMEVAMLPAQNRAFSNFRLEMDSAALTRPAA
ncbi:MAG: C45 family autoproteolytic acyltransferase/hydrolase [Caulobacteraceae bacterium]|nr:C45 family autoproteolytic acyltransferase/hydrolase [Caulobacteraceae bacterium]